MPDPVLMLSGDEERQLAAVITDGVAICTRQHVGGRGPCAAVVGYGELNLALPRRFCILHFALTRMAHT